MRKKKKLESNDFPFSCNFLNVAKEWKITCQSQKSGKIWCTETECYVVTRFSISPGMQPGDICH